MMCPHVPVLARSCRASGRIKKTDAPIHAPNLAKAAHLLTSLHSSIVSPLRPRLSSARLGTPLRMSAASVGPAGEITRLLIAWGEGDAAAAEQLMPLVYRELKVMA